MTDYECWPLWLTDESKFYNIDPEELPVSEELKNLLSDWASRYDSILNREMPQDSGFKSPEEEREFEYQGALIFKMMLVEIDDKYVIQHFFKEAIYYSVDELYAALKTIIGNISHFICLSNQ